MFAGGTLAFLQIFEGTNDHILMLCKDVGSYYTCQRYRFPLGTLLWKVSQILGAPYTTLWPKDVNSGSNRFQAYMDSILPILPIISAFPGPWAWLSPKRFFKSPQASGPQAFGHFWIRLVRHETPHQSVFFTLKTML